MTQETAHKPEPTQPETRKPSKGEQVFDWLVYGGIAGVGTFLLTIPLAYAMKYKGGDAWLAKQLAKAKINPDGIGGTAISVTSLMHGGNVMAIPVYLAEKNREGIVDKLNYILDDKTPKEDIVPKPKQTVFSVFTSRITAWLAVFAGWVATESAVPKSFETFQTEVGRRMAKLFGADQYRANGADQIAKLDDLLQQKQRFLNEIESLQHTAPDPKTAKVAIKDIKKTGLRAVQKELEAFETRRFRFGKLSALDVFATAAAATLFFVGNNFFGRLLNEKKTDALAAGAVVKKHTPIQNPTLPRAEQGQQSETRPQFAERLAQEKVQSVDQEMVGAVR